MRLIVCETAEQIRAAQALRYQVFCIEKGWVDPATCSGGLETDEWDALAKHFLVTDDDGTVLGTSRLLMGDKQPLPAAEFIDFEAVGIDVRDVCEVSRVATMRVSRSASMQVFLGICKIMLDWGVAQGYTTCCSIADAPLYLAIKRLGMPIIASADPVFFLGSQCVPSVVDAAGMAELLARHGFSSEIDVA